MTDASATTPVSETSDAVREWASDWADKFSQDYDDESLIPYVGKKISARVETEEGPKGFNGATVVGYSLDRIYYTIEGEQGTHVAVRASFLSDDGKQLAIFAGMEITEDE